MRSSNGSLSRALLATRSTMISLDFPDRLEVFIGTCWCGGHRRGGFHFDGGAFAVNGGKGGFDVFNRGLRTWRVLSVPVILFL